MSLQNLPLIPTSLTEHEGTQYALITTAVKGEKKLVVSGNTDDFEGRAHAETGMLICPMNAHNAYALRERLSWLKPIPLGTYTSAGFGDRLGCATIGHLMATQSTGVMPILAQQSVRENNRTGRTPQQVLDDAMWGAFEFGWRDGCGADADHLKTLVDIAPFVEAGYTFYTIDPGDYVDDAADTDDLATLKQKAEHLDWQTLKSSSQDIVQRLAGDVVLDTGTLHLTEENLLRAIVKYGGAVVHAYTMAQEIKRLMGGQVFDLEVSVDETATTTSHVEHFVITSELHRLGVDFVSLAPRFVGRFEKGVDYIGDLEALERDIAVHGALMRYFGNRYKLSLHTGSDKFGVYPIALKHTNGAVHLKTAGTSYLEALRVMARLEPDAFRQVLALSHTRYEEDRKTYHVSAQLERVAKPETLTDAELPDLLNQFDARQVLHVTYGSVLDVFGTQLNHILKHHEAAYHAGLKAHFDKHLEAF